MGGRNNWDGKHPLPSSPDYDNFRYQLTKVMDEVITDDGSKSISSSNADAPEISSPTCDQTAATLKKVWHRELYPLAKMPSYFSRGFLHLKTKGWANTNTGASARKMPSLFLLVVVALLGALVMLILRRKNSYRKQPQQSSDDESNSDENSCLLLANENPIYS